MRALKQLAWATAALAYAVIVVGYLVRITGSGMGCGPDWPLCNGQLIPSFTSRAVVIEWTHRLAVLGLSVLMLVTVVAAWLTRKSPGAAGPGGTLRPAALVTGLFVVQSGLGRQAVIRDLDALTVVVHLAMALAILATVIVLGARAGLVAGGTASPPVSRPPDLLRGAVGLAVAFGAVTLLLGGVTANLGAMGACAGFPLCSGQLWPAHGLARLQWVHRLVAYALFGTLLFLALTVARRTAPRAMVHATWIAVSAAIVQIGVAAVMATTGFPPLWRGLHAVVGTAVWVALVWLGWLTLGRHTRGAVTQENTERPSPLRR